MDSSMVTQTADMLTQLSEEDLSFVNSLIKRLIRVWDPDFTKVTVAEKKIIDEAEYEIANGDYLTEDEVWK